MASFLSRKDLESKFGEILGDVSGLGYDRRTKAGRAAGAIFNSDDDVTSGGQTYQGAGEFWTDHGTRASGAVNNGPTAKAQSAEAAFVYHDVPTSSTNYSRPRTVAAGYDPERKTMTVVFRDGTFYNYYGVTKGEWESFSASYSKGRPWLNKAAKNPKPGSQAVDGRFIGKQRGYAIPGSVSAEIEAELYRVARQQQILHGPSSKPGRTSHRATRQWQTEGGQKRIVSEPNRTKASINKRTAGINPTKLGTNPKKR